MLTTLMGHVPSRCIVLLEDIDAAFTRLVSRAKDKEKLSFCVLHGVVPNHETNILSLLQKVGERCS
jgi:hypothetical protein